jgi:long-chain acyl-CoA synthetase
MMTTSPETLKELLDRCAERYSAFPALADRNGESFTYAEVRAQAAAVTRMLEASGVGKGDRVAILGENGPRWGIAYLAVTGMGAVVVPILPDFSNRDIETILDHAEVSGLFVSRSFWSRVAARGVGFAVAIDDWSYLRGDHGAGATSEGLEPPTPDDLAAILYTSGTTGSPKGVMLSHRNIVQNVIAAGALVDINPKDRVLSILPLAHTYECTIGFLVPFEGGAAIHYLGGPPTLSSLLPAMQAVRPTIMLTVPLIMEKVYRARVKPLFESSQVMRAVHRITPLRVLLHRIAGKKVYRAFGGALRFFGIGGAALSPETERFLREARFPYSIGYGLTETAPLIAGTDAGETRYRSTGPASEGVEVRIDEEAGDGSAGEIQVRGPNVTAGYYRNPEATEAAFTSDGWLRTGDLGSIDDDGFIYVKGRLKNVIIGPGGENIYPEDIEAAINAEELVQESLVFEWRGELVAKVHLDVDEIRKRSVSGDDGSATGIEARVEEILARIRDAVNLRVGRLSRLGKMLVEWQPFEKTPTKKIRRFLYTTIEQARNRDAADAGDAQSSAGEPSPQT